MRLLFLIPFFAFVFGVSCTNRGNVQTEITPISVEQEQAELTTEFPIENCETSSINNAGSNLLSFFTLLPNDTIISTLCPADILSLHRGNNISDELVLKYFLNNNKEMLYGIDELFCDDRNAWITYTYKRHATAIFAKKITDNLYLLGYWWYSIKDVCCRSVLLSLYDNQDGRFMDTREFFVVSGHEEIQKLGIIFDNNHILTVHTFMEGWETVSYFEYFSIDKVFMRFNTLQKSRATQQIWLDGVCDPRQPIAIQERFKKELRRAGFTFEFTNDGRIKNR